MAPRTAPSSRLHALTRASGITLVLLGAAASAWPQGPSGTDIYLVSVRPTAGALAFGSPVNVTDRDGYDNQPGFMPDGEAVLYTSNRDGQTDIYRYALTTGATVQLTRTNPESEYSPTVTPAQTGFSVIRVEADSTQRLWEFPLEGGRPRLLLADIQPVGYHAWGDARSLGLFVLGTPSTLQLVDVETGTSEIIAYNIGRSIHKVPGRRSISFTHRVGQDRLMIKELDLDSRVVRPLVELLEGNEFYAWMPDGTVLMGQRSRLFHWDPAAGGPWREVADFTAAGVHEISRLAVSPRGDWVAVVGGR